MAQKKAHFIGIAGMGMSATAILLKEQKWEVTGSDSDVYPPATEQLARHQIFFKSSYRENNVPKDADLIVIGKNVKLARENNPEVRAAYESGIKIASFPEVLSEILGHREPIIVAGSYGKSTTTALIAWCLSHAGVDAGWFIGAAPIGLEPAHLGTHPVFVIEGDEYPTSHEDPRPKFAHYHAHDAVITAATHDHVNVYKSQEEFLEPFRTLVKTLPRDGVLLLCEDEVYAASLAKDTEARVVTYGFSSGNWHASNVARKDSTTFDLVHGKGKIPLSTSLLGDHNVQNIVGASAMLLEKKLIAREQLASAVRDFKGLARRLDKKTKTSRVPAYEAFGSSREKLRAARAAVRMQHPDKRLVVVFEPHTFSWRNRNMLHWYDDAFEGAGFVILYKPAEQGASTHEQSTQKEMLVRIASSGVDVAATQDPEMTMQVLSNVVNKHDVVLLSSSGSMDGLIERIPEWLDNTFS